MAVITLNSNGSISLENYNNVYSTEGFGSAVKGFFKKIASFFKWIGEMFKKLLNAIINFFKKEKPNKNQLQVVNKDSEKTGRELYFELLNKNKSFKIFELFKKFSDEELRIVPTAYDTFTQNLNERSTKFSKIISNKSSYFYTSEDKDEDLTNGIKNANEQFIKDLEEKGKDFFKLFIDKGNGKKLGNFIISLNMFKKIIFKHLKEPELKNVKDKRIPKNLHESSTLIIDKFLELARLFNFHNKSLLLEVGVSDIGDLENENKVLYPFRLIETVQGNSFDEFLKNIEKIINECVKTTKIIENEYNKISSIEENEENRDVINAFKRLSNSIIGLTDLSYKSTLKFEEIARVFFTLQIKYSKYEAMARGRYEKVMNEQKK